MLKSEKEFAHYARLVDKNFIQVLASGTELDFGLDVLNKSLTKKVSDILTFALYILNG
jgi:hypothetical protein